MPFLKYLFCVAVGTIVGIIVLFLFGFGYKFIEWIKKGGFEVIGVNNMPRYIDTEKIKKLLTNAFCEKMIASKTQGNEVQKYIAEGINYSLNLINDEVPAADVQEVKHGEWEYKQLDNFRKYMVICPFCKREYVDNYDGYIYANDFNYCPNCGAKMDGDKNAN